MQCPWAVLALIGALGGAPMQCVGEPEPSLGSEESPAEALYALAQELHRAGDEAGWRRALEYLAERYPASRFAVQARQDLADAATGGPR
jgi:outer membrane protein assembly factor BamD (BamD/ComL family)